MPQRPQGRDRRIAGPEWEHVSEVMHVEDARPVRADKGRSLRTWGWDGLIDQSVGTD